MKLSRIDEIAQENIQNEERASWRVLCTFYHSKNENSVRRVQEGTLERVGQGRGRYTGNQAGAAGEVKRERRDNRCQWKEHSGEDGIIQCCLVLKGQGT